VRPLTREALTTDARLLLPSLDGGLCAEKVEPLGSDHTGSNRPVGILECDNKGRVRSRGVGEGGTNPGGELGDSKTPVRWVIEGECMLALCQGVCWGILVNASRNPINQQLAPLDVCPGSEGSHRLLERGLDGGGEDVGSIFELGDGRGWAPNDNQVAFRGPPSGGDPDIGMTGSHDKSIVADRNQ